MTDLAPLLETLQHENAGLRQRLAELEQAVATLRENEAKFRGVIEHSTDVIAVYDEAGHIIEWNTAAADLSGLSRSQVMGQHFSTIAQQLAWIAARISTSAAGAQQVRDAARTGQAPFFYRPTETPIRAASGERRILEQVFFPIKTERGFQIGSIARDITDRKQTEAALQRSEEQLREAQQLAHIGSWDWDLQRQTLSWSDEVYRIFGLVPGAVTPSAEVLESFIHPDDRDDFVIRRTRMLAETHQAVIDHRIVQPDGTVRWVQERAQVRVDEQGQAYRVIGTVQDITEHRQMEAALRASEERFHMMFMKHSAIMLIVEPDTGAIVDANHAAEQFYGYPLARLCAINIAELNQLPPDQIDLERQNALRARRNYFVFPHRLADGTVHTVEVHSTPITLADRSVLFSIIHDITDRRQAEDALRVSEERWLFALEGAGDGVWDLDFTIQRAFYSPQWKALLGYAAEDIGDSFAEWSDRLHPDDRPGVMAEVQRHIDGLTPIYQSEFRMRAKDGTYRWILGRGKVVSRNPDRQPLRVIGTHTDITDRRRMEEALRTLNATLEQRVTERTVELQAANVRLTELDRLKDEFLSRISHELRTPLAGILIALELLETAKPEKRERYLLRLKEAAYRMRDLIEDVLAFTQLNRSVKLTQPNQFDVNDWLESRLTVWQARCAEHNLALQLDLRPDLPRALADAEMVLQVLTRLLTNAVNYTPTGTVTLATARHDEAGQGWITISVTDTGPGITAEDLPHIFERFYRGRAAADFKTPGTGTGLTISREIAERLGGRLTAETQVGVGSTFTLWLRAA